MPRIMISEEDGFCSKGSSVSDEKSKVAEQFADRLDELLEGQGRILELLELQQESREVRGQQCGRLPSSPHRLLKPTRTTRVPKARTTKFVSSSRTSVANAGWGLPSGWPGCLNVREVGVADQPDTFTTILSRLNRRQKLLEIDGAMAYDGSELINASRGSEQANLPAPSRTGSVSPLNAGPTCSNFKQEEGVTWLRALHPYGHFRALWDEASCLVLAYEMVMIPIVMAWDVQFTRTLMCLAYATVSFWTGDVVLNFFTGYCSHGTIFVEWRAAARCYLRGWFTLDFIVLIVNFFTLWSDMLQTGDTALEATSAARLLISKASCLLRVVSSMRMLRIGEKLNRLANRHVSDDAMALLEISSLLFIFAYASHVFACCWFAISKLAFADTNRSWVSSLLPGTQQTYLQVPMGHQYITAYHWAFSQMSSGAMGLQAENTNERIFNVAVLFVGVALTSTIVSRLTARVAEYSALKSRQSRYVASLTNYLRKGGVDYQLVMAASLQAKDRLTSLDQSSFDPMAALGLLSTSLRATLKNKMFFINWHQAFFKVWSLMEGSKMARSVMHFSSFAIFAKDDTVFEAASNATSMYLVVRGKLVYSQTPDTALVKQLCFVKVEAGSFLAEAALYCDWIHVGKAGVTDTADVLSVNVESFAAEIQKSPVVSHVYNEIAKVFHARLEQPRQPPSDLFIPGTAPADLFQSLPKTALDVISLTAIQALKERHRNQSRLFDQFSPNLEPYCQELQREVLDGLCIMIPYVDGSVQRIAQVVTLKLCRQDGRFLVHLGSVEAGGAHSFKMKVQLAGCKRNAGETVDAAVARILTRWLRPFAKSLNGEEFLTDLDKVSKNNEHNVLLTYERTCISACLTWNGCDGVVCLTAEGPHCAALHFQDAMLLARRGANGAEQDDVAYSLWAWMLEDEFSALQADEAGSSLAAAVAEFVIPKAAFDHAKDHYDLGDLWWSGVE